MNFLVAIEGIDKSGKTTLSKNLYKKLSESEIIIQNKIPVKKIKFPDRNTEIGGIIDKYLKNQINLNPYTIHLLFSANRWENIDKLKDGIVLLDRYIPSGVSYSLSLGCDEKWVDLADKGLPEPDLFIFLDLKPEDAIKRMAFGDEKYENIDFLNKTYKILKNKILDSKNPLIINGTLSEAEMTDVVYKRIIQHIKNKLF